MRPLRLIAPSFACLAVASAAELGAQACIGFPQGSAGALYASFGFPEGGTTYGLNGMVRSQDGGLFFQGGFGITAHDIESIENTKILAAAMAYEIPSLRPSASVCPAVGATYSWLEELNGLSIPFGVGIGTTVQLGTGGEAGLTPFAVPQFLYVRSSIDDVEDSAESDVFVGMGAGATVDIGAFLFGGQVSKIFEEDLDAVFSLLVGVSW